MSQRKIYTPPGVYRAQWQETRSLRLTLDMARSRLLLICCAFVLTFLVIAGRLADVSLFRGGKDSCLAHRGMPHGTHFRADVVDRNGEILATSLKTSSLYANARVVLDPQEAANKLVQVLPELNHKEILHRLQSGKGFVWLARHLTPQKQAEIICLGIPGIYFKEDERRVYPHGELFSHVLGYTNIDNQGLGGVERHFNNRLVESNEPLRLSLDIRVQHVVRDELLAGIEKFKARGGAGLIMNVQTGEVIAMVSLPDFDPNQVGKMGSKATALFNKITLGVYEMGSSFKILNTALYLDSGTSSLFTKFDVSAPLRVGRFRIKDFHPAHCPLTVAEIFTESSNIGAAKMAMQMGSDLQKAFFQKIGFFSPLSLEIPELGAPLYPKKWSDATTITASYGYGVSVSPLHLVTAISGIVNKGVMHKPTLLKVDPSKVDEGVRIISAEVSETMCKLMYMIVAYGRGKKARVPGYDVGGKTGTANTLDGRFYQEGSNMTSFAGAFPMRNPVYGFVFMLDRPQAIQGTYGFNAAGWNAAPTAGLIISRIAPLLHVMPSIDQPQLGEDPFITAVSAPQRKDH